MLRHFSPALQRVEVGSISDEDFKKCCSRYIVLGFLQNSTNQPCSRPSLTVEALTLTVARLTRIHEGDHCKSPSQPFSSWLVTCVLHRGPVAFFGRFAVYGISGSEFAVAGRAMDRSNPSPSAYSSWKEPSEAGQNMAICMIGSTYLHCGLRTAPTLSRSCKS